MKRDMRFNKKGNISPYYISPFKNLEEVGSEVYRLALPPSMLGVHLVFYISILKIYYGDVNCIIKWDSILLDKNISYKDELVVILD